MEIVRFGRVRCEWAGNHKVNLDFCKRHCGLLGAAVCPRSMSFAEFMKQEAENG